MATRGRPKGSVSFVNVNMETLSKLFAPSQNIPVSRVWLEKLKIEIEAQQQTIVKSAAKPAQTTEKIEMSLSV